MIEWIATGTVTLIAFIDKLGYAGIFILMAVESTIIPLPSEAVMIPAGVLASQGQMNLVFAFVAGVLGNVAGAIISYWLGYIIGRKSVERFNERYGKFFLLSPHAIEKTDSYFANHGHITIFLARLIPGVRHLISLPAGFARMNLPKFIGYTALGSAVWCTIMLSLGYILGKNSMLITKDLQLVSTLVIISGILIAGIYWFLHTRKQKRSNTPRAKPRKQRK